MIATLAVAATLLLGGPLDGATEVPASPSGPAHVLDPATLQPAPGSPELPAEAPVEASPDGRRLVVQDQGALRFFDARTGDALGEVALAGGRAALVWPTPDRLLAVQCFGVECGQPGTPEATATVIDPDARTVVATTRLPSSQVTGAEPAGDRVIVMQRSGALVLDGDGAIVHRLEVTGHLVGTLVGHRLDGTVPRPARALSRINAATGEVVSRRFRRPPELLLPQPEDRALVRLATTRYAVVDPATLNVVRRFRSRGDISPMPHGYLELLPLEGRSTPRSRRTLVARRFGGTSRWTASVAYPSYLGQAEYEALGGYVYIQRGLDDRSGHAYPDFRLDVLDADTGRRVRRLPGQYSLTPPGWRQLYGGDPFDGGNLYLDT